MRAAYLELVNEVKNLEGVEFVQDMSATGWNTYRINGTHLYLQIIDVNEYRFYCSPIQVVESKPPVSLSLFLVEPEEALAKLPTESLRTFFLFHLDLLC